MTVRGIVQHLLDSYGTDPEITGIIDNCRVHVLIVANPDGYSYTHTNDRLWRKNRRPNTDGSFGVDTNRNFDYQWNTADSNPGSITYRGLAPNSERETMTLINWINAHPRLGGILNYHSYGQLIMCNWAYTYTDPPNREFMDPLLLRAKESIRAVHGKRYKNAPWSHALEYLGGGTTMDYVHAVMGVPQLSIEMRPDSAGQGGFVLPATEILPSVQEQIPATLAFLHWAIEAVADDAPPQIESIGVLPLSPTQVRVSYRTDRPTRGTLFYGTTAPTQKFAPHRLNDFEHNMTPTNLAAGTEYQYKVSVESMRAATTETMVLRFTTPLSTIPAPLLLSAKRSGPRENQLHWTPVSGSIAGYRVHESNDMISWSMVAEFGADATTGTVAVSKPQLPSYYRLVAYTAAGEGAPADIYPVSHRAGAPRVLLVDDNDGWLASTQRNHAFLANYARPLQEMGIPFESCAGDAAGTTIDLSNYAVVFWTTGNDSSLVLDPREQAVLQQYLEQGGRLFLSGSRIGQFLNGSAPAWYESILHARLVSGDFNDYKVLGSGSIFGDDYVFFRPREFDAMDISTPHSFTALAGTVSMLRQGSNSTGLSYTGTFGGGTMPGRMIYIAFPFESINSAITRQNIMAAALQYFEMEPPPIRSEMWVLE
jgi:hypothetical protein